MKATFFRSPAALRKWFAQNHATAEELLLGYYKTGTDKPSVTWPESVDEALCVGWIDGIRRRVDDDSYTIRFTPRRSRSVWSAINIKRCEALIGQGRMQPAGLKAFQARDESKPGYTYQPLRGQLDDAYERQFRKNETAWTFFQAQAPSYKSKLAWWVMSAKQEPTRLKRLEKLIEASAAAKRL